MTVGWDERGAPAESQEPHAGRVDGQTDRKMAEPVVRLRRYVGLLYTAFEFFAALADGFGAAFFVAFVFSALDEKV
jgi:hypothetical protein